MHPGRVNIGAINNIQICLRMVFDNLIDDIVYSDHCWSLVIGYWSLVARCWSLVTGAWLLVTCHWLLVTCRWLLVDSRRSRVRSYQGPDARNQKPVAGYQPPETSSQQPVASDQRRQSVGLCKNSPGCTRLTAADTGPLNRILLKRKTANGHRLILLDL